MNKLRNTALICALFAYPLFVPAPALAQHAVGSGNGLSGDIDQNRWEEIDSHPLRVAAYVLHPIGWFAREVVFRPISSFAGSSETTRNVLGYREAGGWRSPSCFSKDVAAPDCRTILPFNYDRAGETALNREVASAEVYFPNVLFDFSRKELNVEGRERVKQIASSLSADRSTRVVLEGHTDDVGSESFNQKLGLDRARAVQSELESLGISPERLSSVSFGESRPVDSAKTTEARAKNRRVEVKAAQ